MSFMTLMQKSYKNPISLYKCSQFFIWSHDKQYVIILCNPILGKLYCSADQCMGCNTIIACVVEQHQSFHYRATWRVFFLFCYTVGHMWHVRVGASLEEYASTVNYLSSGWLKLSRACGKSNYWPSLVIQMLSRTSFFQQHNDRCRGIKRSYNPSATTDQVFKH